MIRHGARNNCPAVLFDYNGKNGWSKMEDYKEIQLEENYNPNLHRYARNYYEAQKSLLELKDCL